ncbi:hypothetical protein ZWY2020_026078 [Hordeum vulgare]|nr:hypothetical protein ZWY2020_026078 [Hordeum vulgare]
MKDVQEALHVKLIGAKDWEVCRSVLEYELLNLQIPANNIVGSLLKSAITVLIYRCGELERPIRSSNSEYLSTDCYCGLGHVQVHSRCLTLMLKV